MLLIALISFAAIVAAWIVAPDGSTAARTAPKPVGKPNVAPAGA